MPRVGDNREKPMRCSFCNKAKDDSMGEEFFDRIQRIFLYQAKLRYGKKQFKQLKKTLKELE